MREQVQTDPSRRKIPKKEINPFLSLHPTDLQEKSQSLKNSATLKIAGNTDDEKTGGVACPVKKEMKQRINSFAKCVSIYGSPTRIFPSPHTRGQDMRITRLYTGDDNKSHFDEPEIHLESRGSLGFFTEPTKWAFFFREVPAGLPGPRGTMWSAGSMLSLSKEGLKLRWAVVINGCLAREISCLPRRFRSGTSHPGDR